MKKIVVLTGAGMSAASGLATFRGAGGLWGEYPVQQVATPEGWFKDPTLVTNFYNGLRQQLLTVEPNEGHRILAKLEKKFHVEIITQNVDDLHERAGSTNVTHLHGELTKVCSSKSPNNPKYIKTLTPEQYNVQIGDLAEDGSQIRPFIVWFSEAVPMIEKASNLVQEADILIIIGTSLQVYPAAGLIHFTSKKCPIYVIDPNSLSLPDTKNITQLKMGAVEGMTTLYETLLAKK
ncbi:MAG: Sir2 family NAD-dependent protein deacetylase [Bacteroidaceae bacterium]